MPSGNGRQQVEWSHIRTEPAAELLGHLDAYGNEVRWFQLTEPHAMLVVEAEAVVVDAAGPGPAGERGRGRWWRSRIRSTSTSYAEFLSGSTHIRWVEPVEGFAKGLHLDESGSLVRWGTMLEAEINEAIVYHARRHRGRHPGRGGGAGRPRRLPGHGAPHDRRRPAPRRRRPLRQRLAAPAGDRGPGREPRLGRDRGPGPRLGRVRPDAPLARDRALRAPRRRGATTPTCRRCAAATSARRPRRWTCSSRCASCPPSPECARPAPPSLTSGPRGPGLGSSGDGRSGRRQPPGSPPIAASKGVTSLRPVCPCRQTPCGRSIVSAVPRRTWSPRAPLCGPGSTNAIRGSADRSA